MEEYQERVVDERQELKEKISELGDFFDSDTFSELTDYEKMLLGNQHSAMLTYSAVLAKRIDTFVY